MTPEVSRDRVYYRVAEVIAMMGLGRTTIYDAIKLGDIPSRHVGRVVLIPAAWVHAATSSGIRGRR